MNYLLTIYDTNHSQMKLKFYREQKMVNNSEIFNFLGFEFLTIIIGVNVINLCTLYCNNIIKTGPESTYNNNYKNNVSRLCAVVSIFVILYLK